MSDQQPKARLVNPNPDERSWKNLSDPIERLMFMGSCNCTTLAQLRVLLALGQLGGKASPDVLAKRAGITLRSELADICRALAEKRGNSEGVIVFTDEKSDVWLTNSGHESCEVWDKPLSPLCAAKPTGEVLKVSGKVSYFGGPGDKGVSPSEGLALFGVVPPQGQRGHRLFLNRQPDGTTGTARRLNVEMPYIAMRWAYKESELGKDTNGLGKRLAVVTPRSWLLSSMVKVINPETGAFVWAWPCDWGPNGRTNRIADVSPFVMNALGLKTDDLVEVELPINAV